MDNQWTGIGNRINYFPHSIIFLSCLFILQFQRISIALARDNSCQWSKFSGCLISFTFSQDCQTLILTRQTHNARYLKGSNELPLNIENLHFFAQCNRIEIKVYFDILFAYYAYTRDHNGKCGCYGSVECFWFGQQVEHFIVDHKLGKKFFPKLLYADGSVYEWEKAWDIRINHTWNWWMRM